MLPMNGRDYTVKDAQYNGGRQRDRIDTQDL